jgi:membrane-associated phospholipid phosphatase
VGLLPAALAALAVAAPGATPSARAPHEAGPLEPRPALHVDRDGVARLLAGGLLLWGANAVEQRADDPTRCRWCEPEGVDRLARRTLRWRDTDAAGDASDALFVAVPLGSAAAVAWLAARDGGGTREVVEDVLLVAAAIAVADPLTTAVKHGTARLRPQASDTGVPRVQGDLHAFWSGHTARVFTAAVAAAQVTRLRGRPGWRWVAGVGLAAAATTGYLRVAADQHWATDVLAAAAAGATIGWAVPTLALRAPGSAGRGTGILLEPAPGGLALRF